MSRARKVLEQMSEPLGSDVAESMIPSPSPGVLGIQLTHPVKLLALVNKSLGESAGEDFKKLLLKGQIPADSGPLLSILRGRTDFVSLACVEKLENSNANH